MAYMRAGMISRRTALGRAQYAGGALRGSTNSAFDNRQIGRRGALGCDPDPSTDPSICGYPDLWDSSSCTCVPYSGTAAQSAAATSDGGSSNSNPGTTPSNNASNNASSNTTNSIASGIGTFFGKLFGGSPTIPYQQQTGMSTGTVLALGGAALVVVLIASRK